MSDFSERKIEERLTEPDILDTLRWLSTDRGWQGWVYETARRAADEIERLRGLIARMVDAYDLRMDGAISADDYLTVLDLLREEARRD